jgi:hypothetical protein
VESFHGKLLDDLAYQDRLDGKVAEEFWVRKSASDGRKKCRFGSP